MKHWIIIITAIGLMAVHNRLSTSKYWLLGVLLPLAGIIAAVYQFLFIKITLTVEIIVAYVIFFITTFLLWLVGRHEYKEKELKYMKAKDI